MEAQHGGTCENLEDKEECKEKECGGSIFSVDFKVCGKVKDVHDNSPVPEAKVKIQNLEAVSDATGGFCIENVPAGSAALNATKDGWVDTNMELPPIDKDTTGILVYMSKKQAAKDWRIILTWGETPLDLDAKTTFGSSAACGVSYDQRSTTCPLNGITAELDQDHCFFGSDGKHSCWKTASMPGGPSNEPKPETTTLENVDASTCGDNCRVVFHVSNYMSCLAYNKCPSTCPSADTGTLQASQAEVRVIHGDQQVAFFQLAKGDGKIRYGPDDDWAKWGMTYNQLYEEWYVFAIDVNKNNTIVNCKSEKCY